jgi:hypothetical protein
MKKKYNLSRGKRRPAISYHGEALITIGLDDVTFEYFKAESERTGKALETLVNSALEEIMGTVERQPTTTGIREIPSFGTRRGKELKTTNRAPKTLRYRNTGEAISKSARHALATSQEREPQAVYGLRSFPARGGSVTNALIDEIRDDDA